MAEPKRPAKVSVVMDAYGRAALLERSLWTLTRQTYGPIEIVIADDGGEPLGQFAGPNVIVIRTRPADSRVRAGSTALRAAYEACTGNYIITTSPETLVPLDAIEKMLRQHDIKRRSVPRLYCLDQAQTNSLDAIDWRSDVHLIQNFPGFSATLSPSGVANGDSDGLRHHMQFSGQFRDAWELTGFLPATETYAVYDESWMREQEIAAGRGPHAINLAVYHQWHERVLPFPQPTSVRVSRSRAAQRVRSG